MDFVRFWQGLIQGAGFTTSECRVSEITPVVTALGAGISGFCRLRLIDSPFEFPFERIVEGTTKF